MKCDVLVAGVGGQGTILASRLIAQSAMEDGCFVRSSETIGMAQRGGSVVSHVRVDGEDKSSVIPLHTADLLLAFEPAEAARVLPRLKKGGKAVVNTQRVIPVTASLSGKPYDLDEIKGYIGRHADAYFIDAYGIAKACGNPKTVNIVLIGAAIGIGAIPFSLERMRGLLTRTLPQKILDINLKALGAGYDSVQ
ncbi:indolepyruvate oxidoreductase subunit beta [Christensenella timonensis]|uniref:indolepyruvate oxidoreductase subunit beta n=1 Tax=Christensenella timonensis TaxID=1816678 RepID=UPI000835FA8D|nr:indolepyruvate oxidoreductase subunit beta [Christensenella timonensis]